MKYCGAKKDIGLILLWLYCEVAEGTQQEGKIEQNHSIVCPGKEQLLIISHYGYLDMTLTITYLWAASLKK